MPFKSILCGVEGNPSSTEAARQAIAVAKPGGKVHFVAVYTSWELGPDFTKEKLQEALKEATTMADEAGVTATTEMPSSRYAVEVLLREGKNHDLLVIGTHGRSRAVGIMMGSTATKTAHGTEVPLLIAREPPGAAGFPSDILFTSDGADDSWPPARVAARLAADFDANLELVHVEDGKHPDAAEVITAQVEEIEKIAGGKPVVAQPKGSATDHIVELSKEKGSSLIICGRRGLSGIRSLGSVSERVAHQADCSVMLVPSDSAD
ncbi:MAG TPA: universal stress protein [Solirubrobacterales bacterium]